MGHQARQAHQEDVRHATPTAQNAFLCRVPHLTQRYAAESSRSPSAGVATLRPVSQIAIDVVEISLRSPAVSRRAGAVRRWLLDSGVIEPNADRDDLWQPSQYRAGPRVPRAAPGFDREVRQVNNGVDIITERSLFHPYENYEPPDCPGCGTPIGREFHAGLIEPWLLDSEPRVACRECGRQTPLGDWLGHGDEFGQWTFYVGELAVSFNNWPVLSQSFIAELGSRLGPRWRVVSQHR